MSSVTEVKQAPGRWQLDLIEGTPREIIDQLTPFGHIAIAPGKIDVAQVGDNLLTEARYVGVYRGGKVAGDGFSLEGSGMAFWVGDEDGKGPLIESLAVSASTFAATVTALLPDAVEVGTLYSVGGSATLTHTFQWETVKSALNYTTRAFSTPSAPVSWRINGDATIDAGPDSSLFQLTPTAILVKKDQVLRTGRGFDIIGVSGDLQLEEMFNDYTTKVVVLGQGEGAAIVAASASLAASAVLYTDMHGNKVSFARLVDEFEAEENVAAAVAASLLSRFDSPSYGATLSSDDYDVRGDFRPGDHVATYAPDIGFVDYSHEIYYEGVPINPAYVQVHGLTWPILSGFTVGFRTMSGTWLDLSDYYKPASGQTLIDVGDNPSGLTSLGFDPVDRSRTVADSSIPDIPVFGDFYTGHYKNTDGETRGQVLLTWTQPLNTDSSTIVDGLQYEIRYRPNVTAPYAATWSEAEQDTWAELFTWMQPRVPPFDTDEWHVIEVPFDQTQVMVNELFPSVVYEFQIRAVDGANPPNRSQWSASTAYGVARDTLPPAQPAAPVVAGSRLALQVVHYLGRNDGGTFNLDLDTEWLEIHVSGDPQFFADDSTMAGRVPVAAALAAGTPVVAAVMVEEVTERYVRVVAVDRDGNRSNASNTAVATAELIDDAHISDLTATKITAGTISTDLLLSGSIRTGSSGQRVELNAAGLQAYDSDGFLTTNISSDPDDTAQYISFTNAGETLAAISDDGDGSFQNVYANTLYLGGDNLNDRLVYEPARGVQAFSGYEYSDIIGAGPLSEKGYLELAFTAEEGRAYKITCSAPMRSSSAAAGEQLYFFLRDGFGDVPGLSSQTMHSQQFPSTLGTTRDAQCTLTYFISCPEGDQYDFTPGLHRLLWTFMARDGTATLDGASGPSFMLIEDVGPSDWLLGTGVLNDGSTTGIGAGVYKYDRTYTATWSATYDNSLRRLGSLSRVYQGEFGDDGTLWGLWGFPEALQSDLAGATIASAKLTLYANHWHYPSGGTAILGYHDYTAAPASISSTHYSSDVQQQTGWPRPGARTVTLDETFHDAFQSGEGRGILIGDSSYDGDLRYYGSFDGATQTRPPTLRVVYTK